MSYVIICFVAVAVSGLTLFSGFGLGTLLMPAFALFFPVEIAVGATAVVHLANNTFKAFLVGRKANLVVVLKFALPAAVAAVFGALLLDYVSGLKPLTEYTLAGKAMMITPVNLVVAVLIMSFGLIELSSRFEQLRFDTRFIPLGGIISGFFGGLSGHQGALRSAFLMRAGLGKEAFVGTGVLSAVVVDVSRILVYGATFFSKQLTVLEHQDITGLVLAGCLSAFFGAFIGASLLKKITMRGIQATVGIMLVLLSVALGLGFV
ncbi:MAG: TSUP family transporter [Hyphomicrobiales bacterium]